MDVVAKLNGLDSGTCYALKTDTILLVALSDDKILSNEDTATTSRPLVFSRKKKKDNRCYDVGS